jgi:drug/metabolite transporter (DMT)-like permease
MLDANRRRRLAVALLWVVPAVWSSNYLIARAAAPHVPPHVLASGRWGIVALVLLAWSWRSLAADTGRLRGEWKQCLLLGALGMWICGAWVYIGGRTTSATNIALIYAAAPVGIALVSAKLLGERLVTRQKLGMMLALAGVVFVITRGDPAVLAGLKFTAGDLWVAAAMVSWVAYSILLLYWPTRLSGVERLCCMAAGGLLLMLPFTMVEMATMKQALTGRACGLIALAALLPGLMSYLAHGFIQRELGASRTALMLYLAPVYGAGLSWLLLGEAPQWYHWVGAALVLPSIHLASTPSPRQRTA